SDLSVPPSNSITGFFLGRPRGLPVDFFAGATASLSPSTTAFFGRPRLPVPPATGFLACFGFLVGLRPSVGPSVGCLGGRPRFLGAGFSVPLLVAALLDSCSELPT